jgi:hypothetical protein
MGKVAGAPHHSAHVREREVGPAREFAVGDTVMLLRPPEHKLVHGAVGPYVVVDAEETGSFYSVALLGADGQPSGSPARAAASQLRPFDMSRTTPEAEWLRLHWQEFEDDTCPTRAVTRSRESLRADAAEGDLEFEVIWITPRGDETTWEPARYLSEAGNVHFKDFVRKHRLVGRVREQVTRELAKGRRRGAS